jgi:hypothetical protein
MIRFFTTPNCRTTDAAAAHSEYEGRFHLPKQFVGVQKLPEVYTFIPSPRFWYILEGIGINTLISLITYFVGRHLLYFFGHVVCVFRGHLLLLTQFGALNHEKAGNPGPNEGCLISLAAARVARFFLVQHTKAGIIYHMATKYTKKS